MFVSVSLVPSDRYAVGTLGTVGIMGNLWIMGILGILGIRSCVIRVVIIVRLFGLAV